MADKYITTHFHHIVNECDFPIDCKQGLYLSLLGCLEKNVSYAGAKWPWVFYHEPRIDAFDREANQVIDIKNMLTNDSIKKTFDVSLDYYFFTDYINMIKFIRHNIRNNHPVIINTDQYYIPYHKEFIYLHTHGLHAALLMGYNDDQEEALVFSVTPEYKGVIPYQHLSESIKNSAVLWCAVMEKMPSGPVKTNDEIIFTSFQKDLHNVRNVYEEKDNPFLEPNIQIYTKDILAVFSKCCELDDDQTYNNFRNLCEGRWGWEINSNINLLIKYLQTEYVSGRYKDLTSVLKLIEEHQRKWNIAYRKMYKMLRKKPQDINKEVEVVTENFKTLIKSEVVIMKQLIL